MLMISSYYLGGLACEDTPETPSVQRPSGALDADADTDTDTDADTDADSDADGESDSSVDAMETTIDEGTPCSIENLTRGCCNGYGYQVCNSDLEWTECDCRPLIVTGSEPEGNKNTEIAFEWTETVPTPGECLPGTYKGTFDGNYRQTDLFKPIIFGKMGVVPIEGNVTIRLAETGNGEIFTVEEGNFNGFVYGFIPFRAKVNGTLDCSAAEFSGEIYDGTYNLTGFNFAPTIPRVNYFEGGYSSSYDKIEHEFVNGKWHVEEESDRNIESGGKGSWLAGLKN
jgi:hypothetical protein